MDVMRAFQMDCKICLDPLSLLVLVQSYVRVALMDEMMGDLIHLE